RVDEPADPHRRYVLDDVDQHRPVKGQVQSAAHPRVIKRFSFTVDPGALDHALVEGGGGQAGCRLRLAGGDRVGDADIIAAARQYRRPELGRKREQIVKFDAIKIGQPFVPIIRVLLHYPDLVLDIAHSAERTGTRVCGQLAQVVVVVLERLL